MVKAEILAPAGSMQCVEAGVRSGADAVYLGVGSFNARRNAENLTFEELEKAVRYCHERGVKVHLTLNTLVSDDEIKEAVMTAKRAIKCGVDALIVQDMGLARAIKMVIPKAVLHASTQTSVQTEYGIEFLQKNDFTRVVLPRELSKEEILNLLKKSSIELEMFVHGALCMSVSGQCYMSAMIGQRSGNRGLCAQPCRLPFSTDGSEKYYLSLKDNSLIDYIPEMAKAGISSFKIEGRMKRPEYVAGAVKACRNALEGKQDKSLRNNLKDVFSRSGFTDGYYNSNLGKEMFGVRTKADSENASQAIKQLRKLFEKENAKFEISFFVKIKENDFPKVTAKSMGYKAVIVSDILSQTANNKPINEKDVKAQFQKLGATPFYLGDFLCEIEGMPFVSSSALNSMRRQAVEEILKQFSDEREVFFNENAFTEYPSHKSDKQKTYYVFLNENQVPESLKDKEIFFPVFSDDTAFKKYNNSGAVMPAGEMHNADKILKRMKQLEEIGVRKVICPTIDALSIASKFSFEIIMGFNSNIYNTQCLEFFKNNGADECVVSVELSKNKINSLGGDTPRGVIAYGKIPLMLTRNCPIKNAKTCGECKCSSGLIDRKGERFEVICENSFSRILNPYPIYIFDKKDDFYNVDFFMLYFTTESRQEIEDIINDYELGAPAGNKKFTRGLYYRKTE